jgi:hypothetical protein
MKSNFLKLVLPAFAILLAVGLAFATEDSSVDQVAYYQTSSGVQSVTIGDECQPNNEIDCKYLGFQLYAEASLTTKLGRNE